MSDVPDSREIIVRVSGVSKRFSHTPELARRPGVADLLRAMLGQTRRVQGATLRGDEFWAVRDVSFVLRRGEALGIVGLNGAGKSTLLKMLLNRFRPDRGTIEIHGQAGGLIELGAGFHPELPGRRNIYIAASLLGVTEAEVDVTIDRIIDFADIGRFIDSPVKSYSSGMRVRLGFSIAIHFVPDLVICDEVLAVGDFEFRQKCYLKLSEIKASRSFILVSHSPGDIRDFCDRALLLHNGELIVDGAPDHVLDCYSHCEHRMGADEVRMRIAGMKQRTGSNGRKRPGPVSVKSPAEVRARRQNEKNLNREQMETVLGREYWNGEYVGSLRVRWNLEREDAGFFYVFPNVFSMEIAFDLLRPCANFQVGVPFRSADGTIVLGPSNVKDRRRLEPGHHCVQLTCATLPMHAGRLWPLVALSDMPGFMVRRYLPTVDFFGAEGEYGQVHCEYAVKFERVGYRHPFEEEALAEVLAAAAP